MSNTNAPFGLRCVGSLSGNDFRISQRKIQNGYNTSIYNGDAVVSASGYITRFANGGAGISGVVVGFAWLSKANGYYKWFPYYPASSTDPTGDIDCWIIDDPGAIFQVQAGATPIALADIGKNVDIVADAGSTTTGRSKEYVSSTYLGTTATLPLKVTAIPGISTMDVFTDYSSGYNVIEVTFNDQSFKQTTGGF